MAALASVIWAKGDSALFEASASTEFELLAEQPKPAMLETIKAITKNNCFIRPMILARWKDEGAPGEQMHMQMKNRLPAVCIGIYHHTIPVGGKTTAPSDSGRR